MKKAISKQKDVKFIKCNSPFTIDKSKEWGEGNFQNFPNGGFLKLNDDNTVSHGVQPNEDFSAPVGWEKNVVTGNYNKLPIWVDEITETLEPGTKKILKTLDGEFTYEIKKPSIIVMNTKNGNPILEDVWIMTWEDFHKNYELFDKIERF